MLKKGRILTNNGNRLTFFKSKRAICEFYEWTDGEFKLFLGLKMPVLRINGRYMAHQENIENWLKSLTGQQRTVDIDEERLFEP